jgi:hypothetical protein
MAETLINAVLPTKPSTDEINKAAPLRAQVRSAVLKRYDLFQEESPIYTKAGLSYWNLRPLKTFLEAEVAWWNANIELTTLQVNTRKTAYVETLAALNKDLEKALKPKLASMDKEKSSEIINSLRVVIDKNSSEGFDNAPSALSSPSSIDLSGATSTINLANVQSEVKTSVQELLRASPAVKEAAAAAAATKERTWSDDVYSAGKYALIYASSLLYIIIALRLASFAANDLLYKPILYRVIAFIYTFIYMPFLFPYYIYREIKHWFWPSVDAPHFESIFPAVPYEPGNVITLDQKIYGYGNTPRLLNWMDKMRQEQTANRIAAVQNTARVLEALISAKENP